MTDEDRKAPLVLVCHQRAGSTALHSALKHGGGVDSYGEVFHPNGDKTKCNFYKYLEDGGSDGLFPIKSTDLAQDMSARYLEFCIASSEKRYCLLDIKYDCWHIIQGPWLNRYLPPLLLRSLNDFDAKYLHLIRKNLFLQYFSGVYANQVKRWHYRDSDDETEASIVIDLKGCKREMDGIAANIELFEKYLPKSKTLTFFYEDLFDSDGSISKLISEELQSFLGQQWNSLPISTLKKTPISAHSVVENVGEVLDFFADTEYHQMVSGALQKPSA